MIRGILGGFILILFSFFLFHLTETSTASKKSMIRLKPEEFNIKNGKGGGILKFILNGDPKTLNPALAQETTSTNAIGDLFLGLTKINLKTMEVEPSLAERWEVSEDGKVWIFYLRKNVKWSDGVPFTADDVVFTYNQIYYNDKIPSTARDILTINGKKIKVEKVDKYTVKFTLPDKFAPFLRAVGEVILPKHKLEKYVKEGNFNSAWNVNTPPSEIVGTGPYIMKEYAKGQKIVYEKNPFYYEKDVPYIKKKIGIIVQDPDTALLKFSRGEVDIMGVRIQDLQYVFNIDKDIKIFDLGSTPSTTFLVFNQNPEAKIPKYKIKWFRNKIFRRAISHAIDREGICYLVYNGLAKPLYTPITEANRPYYIEGYYPTFEYDLEKARSLLESIGFKDRDGDGYLEDEEGHTLEFTLLTNAGNKERETIGNIIKEDLKKIGIKVNFLPVDFNSLVTRLTSPPYEWEAVIIGLTGSMDPHFGRNVWHSSGLLHMWNPRQEKPSTDWERKVDELFDRGAVELDPKKRVEIYREAFKIITEEQPMIFIATPKSIMAVYDKFENVFPTVWGWYKDEYMFVK